MAFNENRVRRNPIPLGKHDKIAACHFPAGDTFAFAIADDQRTRTGEVA